MLETLIIGEICYGQFIGKFPFHKYQYLACEKCGNSRWVHLTKGNPDSKFCNLCGSMGKLFKMTKLAYDPQHQGTRISAGNYIYVYYPEHPYCNEAGYVREHRAVMEAWLGRILTEEEIIHHINGNKKDNRIKNLLLFPSQGHHASFHNALRKIQKRFPIIST